MESSLVGDIHSPAPATTASPKTSLRKKFVSSYAVFMGYVAYVNSSPKQISVRRLISYDCFQEWLSSRQKNIVHPLQSFRRVLYAHLRGADNRRPFPADVEAELLKLVRGDEGKQLWRNLFETAGTDPSHIGAKRFLSKGFHEAKKAALPSHGKAKDRTSKGPREKRRKRDPPSQGLDIVEALDTECSLSVTKASRRGKRAVGNEMCSLAWLLREQVKQEPFGAHTAWDILVDVYEKNLFRNGVAYCDKVAVFAGAGRMIPAVSFFLSQPINMNDPRFDFNFLLPRPEERVFLKDRPLGTFMYGTDLLAFYEDDGCKQLFGKSIFNVHVMTLLGSVVLGFYATIRHLPELVEKGVVWKRELWRKADGTCMLVLMKLEFTGNVHIVTMQDHSDFFPEFLSLPLLL